MTGTSSRRYARGVWALEYLSRLLSSGMQLGT